MAEQIPGKEIWVAILLAPVTARMITASIVASLGKG